MSKCTILIGGDLCPTSQNVDLFNDGQIDILFGEIKDEIVNADYSIVNLECPIIKDNTPVEKIGPVLDTNESCAKMLKKLKIDTVCLANNHILDHGKNGFDNTLKVLEENGISYVGVGKNLREASKMLEVNIKNKKIGILAMSEHEFYTASDTEFGTNPLDVINIVNIFNENKKKFDYIVTLIHGGVEHFQYPSPRMQRISRFIIEQGGGCVIWQHSHCPGYIERYRDSYIVYGQGNLLFDIGNQKNMLWHQGYLIKLQIDNEAADIDLIPYLQSFNSHGVHKLSDKEAKVFNMSIFNKVVDMNNTNYIKEIWNKYCMEKRSWYIGEITGYARIVNRLNISSSSFLNHLLFKIFNINKQLLLKYRNLLICESQFDVIENSIDLYLKEKIRNKNG